MGVGKQRAMNDAKLRSVIGILCDKIANELGIASASAPKTMSASEYKKYVLYMKMVENQKRFLLDSDTHCLRSRHAMHRKRSFLTASAGTNISQNKLMSQLNGVHKPKVAGRKMVSQAFAIRKKMDERCEELDRVLAAGNNMNDEDEDVVLPQQLPERRVASSLTLSTVSLQLKCAKFEGEESDYKLCYMSQTDLDKEGMSRDDRVYIMEIKLEGPDRKHRLVVALIVPSPHVAEGKIVLSKVVHILFLFLSSIIKASILCIHESHSSFFWNYFLFAVFTKFLPTFLSSLLLMYYVYWYRHKSTWIWRKIQQP